MVPETGASLTTDQVFSLMKSLKAKALYVLIENGTIIPTGRAVSRGRYGFTHLFSEQAVKVLQRADEIAGEGFPPHIAYRLAKEGWHR